jgi:CxC6 like cysteine cluster associated with KDZ transposases
MSAGVTDGVEFGHTCCTVSDCTIPLTDQQDRYCPVHMDCQYICCIEGCQNRVGDGHLTCDIETHRAFETSRTDRAVYGALPLLRQRLRRAGVDNVALAGSGEAENTGGNVPQQHPTDRSAVSHLLGSALKH